MRILLIDDEEQLRRTIRTTLELSGHTVTEAATGLAALPLIDDADLVITDILMPECDGIEIMQAIHRNNPALPVIAMSGGGNAIPVDMAMRFSELNGAKCILRKPFTRQDLLRSVEQASAH